MIDHNGGRRFVGHGFDRVLDAGDVAGLSAGFGVLAAAPHGNLRDSDADQEQDQRGIGGGETATQLTQSCGDGQWQEGAGWSAPNAVAAPRGIIVQRRGVRRPVPQDAR